MPKSRKAKAKVKETKAKTEKAKNAKSKSGKATVNAVKIEERASKKLYCLEGCSTQPKSLSSFYKSNYGDYAIMYNGYCPICKTCLQRLSVDEVTGIVTKESIMDVLQKLDKPFVEEIFNTTSSIEDMTNTKFLGHYLRLLNANLKYKNCKFEDSKEIAIRTEEIVKARIERGLEVTEEMKLFWGRGLDNQDYLDLQKKYDTYLQYEKEVDAKKLQDYRQLCVYELQRDKIQYDVSMVKQVKDYHTMINELSDSLGIKAIQKKEELSTDKFVIGLITRYIEDVKKEPIPRYVEDLGGEDKLHELIGIEYVGNLCDSIGIKNKRQAEYDDLMNEHIVKTEDLLTYDDIDDGDSE